MACGGERVPATIPGMRAGRVAEVAGVPVGHVGGPLLLAGSITNAGRAAVLREVDGRHVWTTK